MGGGRCGEAWLRDKTVVPDIGLPGRVRTTEKPRQQRIKGLAFTL